MYLAKIAASLRLQTLVTVTSEVQIRSLLDLPAGAFDGLIVSNRELEDFSFDMTGEQALRLLRSEALEELRGKMGRDLLVLAEGRVGIIERAGASGSKKTARRYVEELREAGAAGAVVGGGLAAAAATRATAEALDALNPLPA
jgi:indole-3-glycerol phosphate synthase